jgi:penicillin-binding protein 1A
VIKRFILLLFTVFLTTSAVAALFITWGYFYLTRDLPRLARIEDYQPPAVSRVLARDGTLIAEFFVEKRYPVKFADIPVRVRQAFLAAEDASFYSHHGIDIVSIARAVYKNLQSGNAKQGASTITQQVVKNLLLTPEKSLIRKGKEAILSYRLERRFSKDEIFEIYLNQIFFGNGAYGIKAAGRIYFHKELSELSVGEAAMLAGLPKAPSNYSPLRSMDAAKQRQTMVLVQMRKAGFISQLEFESAEKERLVVYPQSQQNIFASPYYVGEIRRVFAERWKDLDIDTDGLEITTAVDLKADRLALEALRNGLRGVDKRRGWRGPIAQLTQAQFIAKYRERSLALNEPTPAYVRSVGRSGVRVLVGSKEYQLDLNDSPWARKFLEGAEETRVVDPATILKEGHVIEVSLKEIDSGAKDGAKSGAVSSTARSAEKRIVLDQTPQVEGAVVLLDPLSGEVRSMAGGYDYNQSQFNRVTQSLRQPGSSFKPIVYLAAVDKFSYTPATIVYDIPRSFRVGDSVWTPANFDEKFLGPITLRTALEKSRNLVSADIVSRVGVGAVIDYARLLGITSPLGRNLSLSLGSSEVSPLEITRSYGVFPAKGVLFDSVFVLKIRDRFGRILYDYEVERPQAAKRVIGEGSAFVMAHMMKGVIENGTGYKIKELGRPVAGKTGTSNDQMDAWFVGYTPKWVCGVWVGFDQKRSIGPKETGGVVSAPIWLDFMRNFLSYEEGAVGGDLEREARLEAQLLGIKYREPKVEKQLDFAVPEGVEPFWVSRRTGARSAPSVAGSILEYFVKGTEPEVGSEDFFAEEEDAAAGSEYGGGYGAAEEESSTSYLESAEL